MRADSNEGAVTNPTDIRRTINARIADEDRIVRRAVRLLSEQVPLEDWPEDIRSAIAGALADSGGDTIEDAKARRLQTHLFVGLPGLAPDEDLRRSTAAERIRADLADLVPYVEDIADRIQMPEVVRRKVDLMRKTNDVRSALLLKAAVTHRHESIRPDPEDPTHSIFDASGASDMVSSLVANRRDLVTAVAGSVLKERSPERYTEWRVQVGSGRRAPSC